MNHNATDDIKDQINLSADAIYANLSGLINYIDKSVRNDVSRCHPAYASLLLMIDSTCVDVIYPLNGFWLALGYTLILYIPAIFIMFKLINLFRVYTCLEDYESDEGFDNEYAMKIMAQNRSQVRSHRVHNL